MEVETVPTEQADEQPMIQSTPPRNKPETRSSTNKPSKRTSAVTPSETATKKPKNNNRGANKDKKDDVASKNVYIVIVRCGLPPLMLDSYESFAEYKEIYSHHIDDHKTFNTEEAAKYEMKLLEDNYNKEQEYIQTQQQKQTEGDPTESDKEGVKNDLNSRMIEAIANETTYCTMKLDYFSPPFANKTIVLVTLFDRQDRVYWCNKANVLAQIAEKYGQVRYKLRVEESPNSPTAKDDLLKAEMLENFKECCILDKSKGEPDAILTSHNKKDGKDWSVLVNYTSFTNRSPDQEKIRRDVQMLGEALLEMYKNEKFSEWYCKVVGGVDSNMWKSVSNKRCKFFNDCKHAKLIVTKHKTFESKFPTKIANALADISVGRQPPQIDWKTN